MKFEWHPTQAAGIVRAPHSDGGTIVFDLVQPDDMGTLRVTVPKSVPGTHKCLNGAAVIVHWTDYTREQIEVVRSP
jgi:hypothetical protein